ncbi:MAG: 50S ribosomal protein L11 methyltransferase, partial [Clostridia bacterium]|nr:50S ribosomal protein L11 methyltransferase [Clostridia bacterium]
MSNSKYLEITVATTSLGSELVANLFFEIGCDAVSIIDKNDLQDLYNRKETWDYVDENLFNMDETVYVKSGVLKSEYDVVYENLKDKLDNLKKLSSFDLGSLEIDAKDIEEEDWRYVWRKFYKPIKVGKFVVIPKWIDYSLSSGEYPIYIEPGMAFGTGEHETTKNALRLLSTIDLSEKVVADVGTGSGILGIGAIRLGAKYCYMYDIDSQCIETATENAKLNDVQNCEIVCADL